MTQTIAGELTPHGMTREIALDVRGVLANGHLVVVGSTVIQFADYDIAQPVSMSVVSIEDPGTMELQVVFAKAWSTSHHKEGPSDVPLFCVPNAGAA